MFYYIAEVVILKILTGAQKICDGYNIAYKLKVSYGCETAVLHVK